MSNLSDIGFPTPDEQAVNDMIWHVIEMTTPIHTSQGIYLKFSDESGAEIYLQGNEAQELIGFNPHFAGKSRRKVGLTQKIERDSSELDGGFYGWANSSGDDVENSSEYPFVFDVPDFRTVEIEDLPVVKEIQLTAFASNDFKIFANEKDFADLTDSELNHSLQLFTVSGLSEFDETDQSIDMNLIRPIGMISGEIKEFEMRINKTSGEKFYWFLIETLGGEIDLVCDPKFVTQEPKIGGIVSGHFWLSGKIL